jgi:hypothetical protein
MKKLNHYSRPSAPPRKSHAIDLACRDTSSRTKSASGADGLEKNLQMKIYSEKRPPQSEREPPSHSEYRSSAATRRPLGGTLGGTRLRFSLLPHTSSLRARARRCAMPARDEITCPLAHWTSSKGVVKCRTDARVVELSCCGGSMHCAKLRKTPEMQCQRRCASRSGCHNARVICGAALIDGCGQCAQKSRQGGAWVSYPIMRRLRVRSNQPLAIVQRGCVTVL